MRTIFFASPITTEPATYGSNIYEAFSPNASFARVLELGMRSSSDRAYLHRRLEPGRGTVFETLVTTRQMEEQRGHVFLPAILDSPYPETASGYAIVRRQWAIRLVANP